jgi:hypothetical protein
MPNPIFGPATYIPCGPSDYGSYASPTFTDIDGDGDLDALVGDDFGKTRFSPNAGPVPVRGVTITPSGGGTAVTEGGASDSYSVVLTRAPTADVTITLNDTNGQVSTDVASLTFTSANWNVAQTVRVSAVNDTVGEGAHTGAIQHLVTSMDAGYNNFVVAPVAVAIIDNDLPQRDPFFGATTIPFSLTDVGSYASPTFADIDGDGDLDAFVGNYTGQTLFYRNTGTAEAAVFSAAAVTPFGLPYVGYIARPTLVDIDGDGDLDAFIGNLRGNTLFARNTASAGATDPVFSAPETNPFGLTDGGYYARPTFADIDGDGDLDAFLGNSGGTLFYRNTASAGATAPIFSAPETNPFGLTYVGFIASPTLVDIDGDGDLDAFVGNSAGNTLFYRNTASAGATEPIFSAEGTNLFGLTDVGSFASPTFADIDGDGDLDAFVGSGKGNTLFFINEDVLPWSSLTDGQIVAFDPVQSVLRFDSNSISAAVVALSKASGSTPLTHDGKTVRLKTGLKTITTTNITFDDGSLLIVGDNTTSTANDDAANSLAGGTGADLLFGLGGADILSGGAGSDILRGGADSDILTGGAGADSLYGGLDNDRYVVGSASDVVSETSSLATEIDTVQSTVTWTLGANLERLVLTGAAAINGTGNTLANELFGNDGTNVLKGRAGIDTLTGFSGIATNGAAEIDTLTGGTEADRFVLGNATMVFYDDLLTGNAGRGGYALITDFTAAADQLQLKGTATDYYLGASGFGAIDGIGLFHEQGATDELIAIVRSANATTLTAANTIQTSVFI